MTRMPVRLVAVLGVILLAQGQPSAQVITSNLIVPFEATIDVPLSDGISTESVTLTGAIHVMSVLQPVDPCSPKLRCRIEVTLAGVNGEGEDTGSHYSAIGSDVLVPTPPPISESLDFSLFVPPNPVVPPNPTLPPNPIVPPDPILPLRVTLEFEFDGAVLTDVTVVDVTIPGCGFDVCPE